MPRKDLAIRTALDMSKFNKTFAGSQLMSPINPQQAALQYGSAIKAALSLIGTYNIVDDGFGDSIGISNNDFVAHVVYNDTAYFTWSGYYLTNVAITILKAGLCWIHIHSEGTLTLDGTNPKQLSTQISQSGSVIDTVTNFSVSLPGATALGCGEASGLFNVVAGDILTASLRAKWPEVSASPIAVRFEVMQIY
jgi:hypothetical protein